MAKKLEEGTITPDMRKVMGGFAELQKAIQASDRQDEAEGITPPPSQYRDLRRGVKHVKKMEQQPAQAVTVEAAPVAAIAFPEPHELLFAAINTGDAQAINAIMDKHHIPVNPPEGSKYGFPESLLQRAVRAQQMPSAVALLDRASEDSNQWGELVNKKNVVDGNTVLHDLAATIPASHTLQQEENADWKPFTLMHYLVDSNANPLRKNNDGKKPGDIAVNDEVREYLQGIERDEKAFTAKWQEKVRPGAVDVEPLGETPAKAAGRIRLVRARKAHDEAAQQPASKAR